MMTTIAKRFTFDAAHRVPTMPEGHKCRRMHGHTYEVEIVLRGHVPASGILLDYGDIAEAWRPIGEALDHRTLNDIPGLEVPTTEVLVGWIIRRIRDEADWMGKDRDPQVAAVIAVWTLLHSIRIKESSTTWCEMSKVEFLAFCGDMS